MRAPMLCVHEVRHWELQVGWGVGGGGEGAGGQVHGVHPEGTNQGRHYMSIYADAIHRFM